MARRPKLTDRQLRSIAEYLSASDATVEFHAEMPARHSFQFERDYQAATNGVSVPPSLRDTAYYIWPDPSNKYGVELRFYFRAYAELPEALVDLLPPGRNWYGRPGTLRVNHTNLVMQLFECGFILGANQDAGRIGDFIRRRFTEEDG